MQPYEQIGKLIVEIEQEMRRLQLWSEADLQPEQYEFEQAFGLDKMAFVEWLQYVFIPTIKGVVALRGFLPETSEVGAQAVKEFDGQPEATTLIHLLGTFDAIIQQP